MNFDNEVTKIPACPSLLPISARRRSGRREKMNCSNHVAEIVGKERENLIGMVDGVEFELHSISI